jgi:serine/threonine protein phosphatase PrpC
MAYPFQWGVATHIGNVREKNEDAFAAVPELGAFLVLDGLGGHPCGEVAAQAAADGLPVAIAEQLGSMKMRRPRSVRRWLARVIDEQSRRIHVQGLALGGCEDMGATLALVLLLDGRAYVANLGDSRVYRLRAGRLVQLSRDHSVIRELVEEGRIEPGAAANHRAVGIVTQHLGMPDPAEPHVRSYALKRGDQFLLCTDGLTDQVPDSDVRAVLQSSGDCRTACESLVKAANAHGGLDNVTVVLARWTGEQP